MARRKKVFTQYFPSLEESFDYIKEVKRINDAQVECEMYELCYRNGHSVWYVVVWQIK